MTLATEKFSSIRPENPASGARARIKIADAPAHRVSEMLLGHNIEAAGFSVAGMLSNRLDNPKFVGPPNPNGTAPSWTLNAFNLATFKAELTVGMSLSGRESQWLHNWHDGSRTGLVQTNRSVRAGETLVVDFWAKAVSQPVKVWIGLSSPELRKEELYDIAETTVNASYWKHYQVKLKAPESTDQATFQFFVIGPGNLWVDQIHMRAEGEGPLCDDLLKRLASMRIPILRFPGGSISTNYRWKNGTGPVHLRPAVQDVVFKMPVYYDFGTDEYLELCHAQNVTPLITVNIGSGTVDEAGEWAAYVADFYRRRGTEPPLAYFQMGNEQYGGWESSHMTGQMYVEALREFIPAVRKNYPNPRIIALGEEHFQAMRPTEDTAWRSRVLDVAGELGIDVLTLNRYKGQWYEADIDKQINVVESVSKVRHDLETMISQCRQRGLKTRVALTEWNYWMTALPWGGPEFVEDYTTRHALYVAGMLHMFARLGSDVELTTFYHLINPMGIFRHRTADVEESCVVEVFRLYRPAFGGEYIPLDINSPALGEHESAVDALCIKNDAGTWLFLCNRHPHDPIPIDLPGLPAKPRQATMLQSDSPMGQLTPTEPPRINKDSVTLPPMSLLRLNWEL